VAQSKSQTRDLIIRWDEDSPNSLSPLSILVSHFHFLGGDCSTVLQHLALLADLQDLLWCRAGLSFAQRASRLWQPSWWDAKAMGLARSCSLCPHSVAHSPSPMQQCDQPRHSLHQLAASQSRAPATGHQRSMCLVQALLVCHIQPLQ
jgi:hypothetical protein